ncbi:MAG: DUF2279 domain-containing protein [Ignavibacteria bacterium]|nr:DUF2279 domain-containing protein [Ignavibacteria bacterium]
MQITFAGSGNNFEYKISLKLKEKKTTNIFYNDKINKNNFTRIKFLEKKNSIYQNTYPQSSEPLKIKKQSKVSPLKMTILGVLAAGVFTGFHIYYANTWWKDQRDYFKFAADGYYARNIDKVSHIYTANVFTVATSAAYEWAGVKPSKALLYGALTSLAYETYIEINDGFAPIWGFDWGDMGANIFGAVYPFLQKAAKPLRHINFKWSFKPRWLKSKISTSQDDLLDDYTNMTFWLSVNPMIALPETVTKAKLYPNFLALAIGMSIKNASHVTGSSNAKVEWILSLDWDVNQLPGKSDFMKKLKKILNFYHFPAPAVKISPEGVWYGLYF